MVADLNDVQLHYVETAEEAAQFVEWTKRPRKTVAVDTETTGLERDARIRLIQFGDETDAWTLRWDRWKGAALEALEGMKRARQELTLHNAAYDIPKIERQSARDGGDGFKFDWGLVSDTMIMSRLSKPTGAHNLKSLTSRLVDPRAGAMQSVLSNAMDANGWTWESVPYDYEGYTVYAGIDCILTARLLPELEKQGFDHSLYRTEMTVLEACIAMSEVGMAVDVQYCVEQVRILEAEIEDIKEQGRDKHRFSSFGSDAMLIERFAGYGCHWEKRTPKGKVSLDVDVLEMLALEADSPAARDLALLAQAYRTRQKLLGTYFLNLIRDSAEDGRVHPDINSLEAVTGRMSIKKPAMQTLPRGPRVRRGFVAAPGNYLMLADYSQIEIRVLAHFCQDPALLQAIATGDVHTASAALIFGCEPEDVGPLQRQLSKSSVLSIIYGAGDEKFAHTAGVPVAQGTQFMADYHSRFTKIKPFTQSVQNVARKRERNGLGAHVTTPAGRRLQMRKAEGYYTLVNYLMQGTAADIFKRAVERLWNTDLGPMLRLPVHDECVFEVPSDLDPEEVKNEAKKHMEDYSMRVPMVVEATGPYGSWADKYGEQ